MVKEKIKDRLNYFNMYIRLLFLFLKDVNILDWLKIIEIIDKEKSIKQILNYV